MKPDCDSLSLDDLRSIRLTRLKGLKQTYLDIESEFRMVEHEWKKRQSLFGYEAANVTFERIWDMLNANKGTFKKLQEIQTKKRNIDPIERLNFWSTIVDLESELGTIDQVRTLLKRSLYQRSSSFDLQGQFGVGGSRALEPFGGTAVLLTAASNLIQSVSYRTRMTPLEFGGVVVVGDQFQALTHLRIIEIPSAGYILQRPECLGNLVHEVGELAISNCPRKKSNKLYDYLANFLPLDSDHQRLVIRQTIADIIACLLVGPIYLVQMLDHGYMPSTIYDDDNQSVLVSTELISTRTWICKKVLENRLKQSTSTRVHEEWEPLMIQLQKKLDIICCDGKVMQTEFEKKIASLTEADLYRAKHNLKEADPETAIDLEDKINYWNAWKAMAISIMKKSWSLRHGFGAAREYTLENAELLEFQEKIKTYLLKSDFIDDGEVMLKSPNRNPYSQIRKSLLDGSLSCDYSPLDIMRSMQGECLGEKVFAPVILSLAYTTIP